jgi:dTDP-glucose 4,6-dehydratase
MKILITGCCGFIGSHLVKTLKDHEIIGVDMRADRFADMRFEYIKDDLSAFYENDISYKFDIFETPDVIINMAAETFVDTSIADAERFIDSNFKGTWRMLELAKKWKVKKFVQISTDEVYGSSSGRYFQEDDRLMPGNPYSATKAAADMLCYSYHNTFGIPINIVRPENNYGRWQSPEKAIPRWIGCSVRDESLPVYGDGKHQRMWLHVEDCCEAIKAVMEHSIFTVYNIGGKQQRFNIDVARSISKDTHFVPDEIARPGHDRSYAIDNKSILGLGWKPKKDVYTELPKIIDWYRGNPQWLK